MRPEKPLNVSRCLPGLGYTQGTNGYRSPLTAATEHAADSRHTGLVHVLHRRIQADKKGAHAPLKSAMENLFYLHNAVAGPLNQLEIVDINKKWPAALIQVYYRLSTCISCFVVVIFSSKIYAPSNPSSTSSPTTENPGSAAEKYCDISNMNATLARQSQPKCHMQTARIGMR